MRGSSLQTAALFRLFACLAVLLLPGALPTAAEAQTTAQFAFDNPSSAAEGETFTLTVELSGDDPAAGSTLTVNAMTNHPGTGKDITPASRTVSFTGGTVGAATFTFTITDDNFAEQWEAVAFTLSGAPPASWDLRNNSSIVAIPPNDNTVEFASAPPKTVAEGAGAAVPLAVTLSSFAPAPGGLPLLVTITEADSDGIADAYVAGDPDWDAAAGVFTVPEGMTGAIIPVVIARDPDMDTDTVTVTIAPAPGFPSAGGWSVGARNSRILTITDTDAPPPVITPPAGTVGFFMETGEIHEPEGGGMGAVTVRVATDMAVPEKTVVNISVAPESTLDASEYSISRHSLTFNPADGAALKTFTVTVRGDDETEPDEYLVIELSKGPSFPADWDIGDGSYRLKVSTNDNFAGIFPSSPSENRATFGFADTSVRYDANSGAPVVMTVEALGDVAPEDIRFRLSYGNYGDEGFPFKFPYPFMGDRPHSPWHFIARGESSATITFTPSAGKAALLAGGGRSVIRLIPSSVFTPRGWTLDRANSTFTINYYDGDDPSSGGKTAGFNASSSALTEGEGAGIVAVDLNTAAPVGGVTVRVAADGGSINFSGGGNTSGRKTVDVAIPAGLTRGFLTVQIANERLFEGVVTETLALERVLIPPDGWSVDGAANSHEITVRGFDTGMSVGFREMSGGGYAYEFESEIFVKNPGPSTVTLSVAPDAAVPSRAVVLVSAPPSGDLKASDYSVSPSSLTFEPSGGMAAKTVTVTVNNDTEAERDEHIAVTLSKGSPFPAGLSIGDDSHTVTIPANDNTARFTNPASAANEGEAHGIGVTLSTPAPGRGPLSAGGLVFSDHCYFRQGADPRGCTIELGELIPASVPAGLGGGALTVKPYEDSDGDHDTFVLRGLAKKPPVGLVWSGEVIFPQTTHTLTILDDDRAVAFTEATSAINEGESATLTVELGGASSENVTLTFASGDSSELAVSPATALIPAGRTTATVTVAAVADNAAEAPEPDETVSVFVSSSAPADWDITGARHTATIPANENTAQFSSAFSTVREGEAVNLTVELSNPAPSGGLTFTVSVSDTPEGDIGGAGDPDTKTFSIDGGATSGTVAFTVRDDAEVESVETFTFILSSSGLAGNMWGGLGARTVHTATVPANDRQREISFAEVSSEVAEGETATLTLTNTNPEEVPPGGLTVTFSAGGGADAADYDLAPPSTVLFNPGEAAAEIILAVNSDTAAEDVETLTVSIDGFSESGWNTGTREHVATIPANGNTAQFASPSSTVSEGGAVNLTVELSNPAPSGGLTFTVSVSDENGDIGGAGDPDTKTFSINAGATSGTVAFTVRDDAEGEAEEVFTFTLSSAGLPHADGWGGLGAQTEHTATVPANDLTAQFAPPVSSTVREGEAVNLTVELNGPAPSGGLTFTVSVSDEGGDIGGAGDPDTKTFSINAGATSGTVAFDIRDDAIPESEETFTFTLSSAGLESGGPGGLGMRTAHTVTVPASGITVGFVSPSSSVREGEEAVLALEAASPHVFPAGGLEVRLSVAETDGDNAPDVTPDSATVTFARNNDPGAVSTAEITLAAASDMIAEDVETLTVFIVNPLAGGWNIDTGGHVITIPANDNTAQFAENMQTVGNEGGAVVLAVDLSSPAPGNFTLTVSGETIMSSGSGGSPDIAPESGTITFAPGDTSGSVTFTVIDDGIPERDFEWVDFTLSGEPPSAWGGLGDRATHRIRITPSGNTAQFASPSSTVSEGSPAVLTLALSGVAPVGGLTFTVSVSDEDGDIGAAGDSDTKTFAVSPFTNSGTVAFDIFDDAIQEGEETFTFILSAGLPAYWGVLGTQITHTATVAVNDNTAGFTAAASTVSEGSFATLTLELNAPAPAGGLELTVENDRPADLTVDGIAAFPATLTVNAGERTLTATAAATADGIAEGDEVATLRITGVSPESWGAAGARAAHAVSIPANDNTVGFTGESTSLGEGESAEIALTLSSPAPPGGLALTITGANSDLSVNGRTSGGTLTIPAGEANPALAVAAEPDAEPEGEETFTLRITGVSPESWGGAGARVTHTVSISASDNTIGFVGAASTVREGNTANLPLILNGEIPAGGLTFTVEATETDGDSNADAPAGTTVTLNQGDKTLGMPVSLNIPVYTDGIAEGEETVTFTISGITTSGWSPVADTAHTITIPANENTAQFSSPASTVSEGGAVNLTVELSAPAPAGGLTFTVSVSDTPEGDIGGAGDPDTKTFSINAGGFSGTVSFDIFDDTVAEDEETLTFTLSSAGLPHADGWGVLGAQTAHTATVPANDNTVNFSSSSSTVREGSSVSRLLILSSPAPAGGLELTVENDRPADLTVGGSAASPVPLTVQAGASAATVMFAAESDAEPEGDETATLRITGVSPGSWGGAGARAAHAVFIPANDNTVEFTGESTSLGEGESTEITLTLSRPAPPGGLVLHVTGANSDLSVNGRTYGGTLTIPAGAANSALAVVAEPDTEPEGEETFTLEIRNFSSSEWGGVGARATHTVFISASGSKIGFAGAGPTRIREGAAAELPLAAGGGAVPVGGLTLTVAASPDVAVIHGGGATIPGAAGGEVRLSPGDATLTVMVVDDTEAEAEKTATVAITGVSESGWSPGVNPAHRVVIPANDNTAQFAEGLAMDGNEGGAVVLTVDLSSPAPGNFTLTVSAADLFGGASSDITPAGITLDFAPGDMSGSVTFTVADDTVREGNYEFAVFTLTGEPPPLWGVLGDRTIHPIRITPSDNTAQFASAASAVSEGGTANLTVNLTGAAPAGGLTFTVSVSDEDGDIGAAGDSDTKTFAVNAGASSGTVSFDIFDDTVAEGGETFTFILSSAGLPAYWGVLGAQITHTVTVSANDNTAQFASPSSTVSEGEAANLTVNLTAPAPAGGLTFTVSVADEGGDIGAAGDSDTKTFAVNAGANSGMVSFDIFDDTVAEGGETFTFTLSSAGLPHADGDIGAAGDSDTKTFSVNAGGFSGTVSFDIFDDTVAEGGETFTFTLSSAGLPHADGWGGLGGQTAHTVTVPANDHSLALVSMSGIGYEGGSVTLTFTAPAPEGGIVLEVTATDSDNDGVADVPLPPTLTLNAGERTLTIDVPEDMMSEPDEMVTLTFRRR